jgi:hypothetical protein
VPEAGEDVGGTETETFFAPSPEAQIEQPGTEEVASGSDAATLAAPPPSPPLRRSGRPAHPDAVRKAIDEVMGIISKLREALEQMDEVLEILEEAERQKTADEREIESLHQALRRFQRPAGEIPRGPSSREQRSPGEQRGAHRPRREQRRSQPPHSATKGQDAAPAGARETAEEQARHRPSSHGTDAEQSNG